MSDCGASHILQCETGQGEAVRGGISRMAPHQVVFQSFDPAVLRMSEVLENVQIALGERTAYAGRGVVTSLVQTGAGTICELGLDQPWHDLPPLPQPGDGAALKREFEDFLGQWGKLYRVLPEYKLAVADLHSFLCDLRAWLEPLELNLRARGGDEAAAIEEGLHHTLGGPVVPMIHSLFDRFERVAAQVEPEALAAHRLFGRRQLHPLLLGSPFVFRTFRKPLGYAGDYEMVNMMFRNPAEGSSMFARAVNGYSLKLAPIEAHRNRITYLTERLTQETLRGLRQNRTTRILNIGCGPAQEIQRFLAQSDLADSTEFMLVDMSGETIEHTEGILRGLQQRHARRASFTFQKKSVVNLLRQAASVRAAPVETYDFTYCAGLFDYLADNVCRKLIESLYARLRPGGLLILTNVDANPSRQQMEHFLDWHLIYRDRVQMASLVPESVPPGQVQLLHDLTGVNLFLEIRKPETRDGAHLAQG